MSYAIHFDLVLPRVKCESPRQAFHKISHEIAASIKCDPAMLYEHMLNDERRTSSACGKGVSIPHMKLKGLPNRFITFAKLDKPLNFDAHDNHKVDLICVLLSPQRDGPIHLRGLSRVTRMLQNDDLLEKLRNAGDKQAVTSLLSNPDGWLLAA